jgi:hypothetical protein
MQRKSLIIALALAAGSAQAADVYKWTDAAGIVHYSDTEPPSSQKSEIVHLNGTAPTTAAAAANDADEGGEAAAKMPPGQLASAVQSAEKRCEQARANLEVLQSKFAVGMDTSGTGKPEVLDDNTRKAQIASAQTIIATYCQ